MREANEPVLAPSLNEQPTAISQGTSEHNDTKTGVPIAPPVGPVPQSFGRYRVVKELGRGGMGSVYLAHDSQLDRQVALKVPHFRLSNDRETRERFYREARAASTLEHPNLCPVFDVGEIDSVPYLTMAYIEGRPLSDLLRREALPPRQVAALVRKLALAMQEAHERGVIHRDLKPSNVMINKRHEPVIMDFGLARRTSSTDVRLTAEQSVLGTPAYMAPEQAKGDIAAIGPGCDIYSLGVILYEMLTGELPFRGSVAEVLGQIVMTPPLPPSTLRPDIPPALEAICVKALAKKPADRHASMGEFAAALGRYLEGDESHVQPIPVIGTTPASAPPADTAGVTSQLVAQLMSRLEELSSVPPPPPPLPQRRGVPQWVWLGVAAVGLALLGVVVYLVTHQTTPVVNDNRTTVQNQVTVQLQGLHVDIHDTTVIVLLDGRPIDPKELQGSLSLDPGAHEVIVKRGDVELEKRAFTVDKQDDKKTIDVPPPEVPLVVVRFDSIKVDDMDVRYKAWLDGQPVQIKALRGKITLRPGRHVLIVKFGEQEIDRQSFEVTPGDDQKQLAVKIEDTRPVLVRLEFPGLKLDGSNLKFFLDGKPITAKELKEPLPLSDGEHELLVVRGDEEDRRPFTVARKDDEQTLSVATAPPIVVTDIVQAVLPLTTDKDVKVRTQAAVSLGKRGDKTALPALMKMLNDKEAPVRKAAAESIETLGDRSVAGALRRRVADDVWFESGYTNVPSDPEAGGKAAALKALRKIAPDQVTDALIAALTAKHGHQRRWAAIELQTQNDRKAVPVLRKRVADNEWYEPRIVGDHDPEWGGKAAALKALREMAPDQVTAALCEALPSTSREVRLWAAVELGLQKDKASVPALKKRVADNLWYEREYTNIDPDPIGGGKGTALRVLRELAPDEVTEPLMAALSGSSPNQRKWAAEQLAVQKDKAAVPALKKRIADDVWYISGFRNIPSDPEGGGKAAALKTLRELAPEQVKEALTMALQSKNADVKTWALKVLTDEPK